MSGPGAVPPGILHIVSTPIGNLADLSPRGVEVLRGVAAILAEDTRHTRILLEHQGIRTPLLAYHDNNEAEAAPTIVRRLQAGDSLALVSDAGTPLLSDPGHRLVTAAIAAGITCSPVPGASALLAALVASGLAADRFTYFGFLPRKGADRRATLAAIVALPHTAVLYEAPGRVGETLADLVAAGGGERPTVIARELTKKFEEFRRGTAADLAEYHREEAPRGEVVVLVGGAPPAPVDEEQLRREAARLRSTGMSTRDIVRVLMDTARAPRNLAYRIANE